MNTCRTLDVFTWNTWNTWPHPPGVPWRPAPMITPGPIGTPVHLEHLPREAPAPGPGTGAPWLTWQGRRCIEFGILAGRSVSNPTSPGPWICGIRNHACDLPRAWREAFSKPVLEDKWRTSPLRKGVMPIKNKKALDCSRAFVGSPTGNRTPVYAVRGRCPNR